MVTTLGPAGVYMLFVLGAAGIAGVTFKVAQYVHKNSVGHESKAARNKRLEYLEGVKEYEKSIGREHVEIARIEFVNKKTGDKIHHDFEVQTAYDEEKDKIYHGLLEYYDENDRPVPPQDIYLFQPRIVYKTAGSEPVTIVPNDIKGYLNRAEVYKFRKRGSQDPQDIYVGYTPKREVLTGSKFDYVDGEHDETINKTTDAEDKAAREADQELRQHVKITMLNKGADGNIVPVDLNDPQERALFEAYKEKYSKSDPTAKYYREFLLDVVLKAKGAIARGFKLIREGEDLDQSGVKAAEAAKAQEKRQAQQQAKPEENAQIREHKRTQQRVRTAYDYGQMGKEIDRSSDGIEGNMIGQTSMPGRPPMGGGPRRR